MADLPAYVLSGLALAVTVAKPIGTFIARLVDGIRSAPDPRATGIPSPLTVEQRLAALEDAHRKAAEAAAEAAQKAAREAAAKELRDLINTAAQSKRTKEPSDGRRSEDPPTKP